MQSDIVECDICGKHAKTESADAGAQLDDRIFNHILVVAGTGGRRGIPVATIVATARPATAGGDRDQHSAENN